MLPLAEFVLQPSLRAVRSVPLNLMQLSDHALDPSCHALDGTSVADQLSFRFLQHYGFAVGKAAAREHAALPVAHPPM